MPVIKFSFSDLKSLVGEPLDFATLVERLPMMGADLHTASRDSDEMAFEFFPDRPDLYSVEGVARALRAFLGISPGLKGYVVGESDIELRVDPTVEQVRPYIWSALVTDLEMSDYLIRSVMDLQEKLHLTVGRNRKKVAIGIHDYDAVKPPFLYTAVRPTEVSFFPLQGSREMNLDEILQHHEKGRAYAFTLEGKDKYPVIFDKEETVLSFPPIINGIATAITEETKNLFVDCTGTDLNALKAAVNILVTSLAERGANIHTVEIHRGEELELAPDLRPWEMRVKMSQVVELTGIEAAPKDIRTYLEMMGYAAEADDSDILVKIPAYRYDILHPADIIEDVAKAHGYERFGTHLPEQSTLGISEPEMDFWDDLRGAMIGLGFVEVSTLTLTGRANQYLRMRTDIPDDLVEVANPRNEDHSMLRTWLIPELMTILRKNKHRDLPQRIFEIGEVVVDAVNSGRIAGASIHSKACFTEMKSIVEALLRSIGLRLKVEPLEHPSFIRGRCASVLLDDVRVGLFGELAPEVITSFELGYPVASFEMETRPLMERAMSSWSA